MLSRMGRNYTIAAFIKIVNEIKQRYPFFNLTTDIMVGFPGETEEDFKATCNIIRDIGFGHIHTFKYSVRHGTRAERMSGQIPGNIIAERSRIIRNISDESKMAYRKMLLGKKQLVLVEKSGINGCAKGYGEHYIPVMFRTADMGNNYFEPVLLNGIDPGSRDLVMTAEKETAT
jgi:threonylcarbamoyladenosine tRNA methylthiotransferase MtaB